MLPKEIVYVGLLAWGVSPVGRQVVAVSIVAAQRLLAYLSGLA